MSNERVARVRASIQEQADAEGTTPSIRHVCLACHGALEAGGVSASLLGELGEGQLVFASDPRAEELAEVQVTLGEGPGRDALGQDRPVLVPDLGANGTRRRWPMFAPAAARLGIGAVFAVPLQIGAIAVGALEIHRTTPGWLSTEQMGLALLYADAALIVLLELDLGAETETALGNGDHLEHPVNGFVDHWAEVHQATGIVSVQLGSSVTEAFIRMRAHAYASDRRLSAVAQDVLARKLRFDLEPG